MPDPNRKRKSEGDRLREETEARASHEAAVKKAKTKRAADDAEEETKRLARMMEGRSLSVPGECGDGNFYISFIQMGQGDCAIVSTPGGATLMIDCGSDATESSREPYDPDKDPDKNKDKAQTKSYLDRIRGVIHHPRHLAKAKQLDYLVFTHPNTDHYNQIDQGLLTGTLVDPETRVKTNTYLDIGVLYHSDDSTAYNLQIDKNNLSAWLLARMGHNPSLTRRVRLLHVVTRPAPGKGEAVKKSTAGATAKGDIDTDNFEIDTVESPTEEANLKGITETIMSKVNDTDVTSTLTPTVNKLDAEGGYVIHTEPNCTITLLAAGVLYNYRNDPSDYTNRGSVVTLIEVFDKRILVCGDATTSTEQYIRFKRTNRTVESERIKNLAILQVGHHGSVTSSHHKFVTATNAQYVVVSTGYKVEKDSLPKAKIISRYRNAQKTAGRTATAHDVAMWYTGAGNFYFRTPLASAAVPIYTTGTNLTQCFKIDKDTKQVVYLNEAGR
ncbi:hypothetical protein [Herbidospora daliensis]|uniref:hypothetical protein n=1 Tax=Herbidospora daliensis TaxID=295585 RepID=UPI0007824A7E|nr:hypothetical protein [Herbidospora daliensis]